LNNKIIISIAVIITIIIIIFSVSQLEISKNESKSNIEESGQINAMLEKIKEDKIKNDNSEKPYKPQPKEWINSGPFFIDRSEYWLGEKIFINIDQVDENTKGSMIFSKPYNNTHFKNYKEINFDGSKKQNNFYLAIYPNQFKKMCTTDDLIGEWEIIFKGTNFEKLKFRVLDKIIPGMEDKYEPVC